MKRILILSDLHCGHQVGLTPPSWWWAKPRTNDADLRTVKRPKYDAVQRACWAFYERQVRRHGPYDCVVVNGDAIDGKGAKSGGTEQITTDRNKQALIAAKAIRVGVSRKTRIIMTYGTGYHTGDSEDFEDNVAEALGAKIGSHEWLDAEGVVFDFKHHVGTSQVPHGRFTAPARDQLWSQLWADAEMTPRADVIVRSHVHYHTYCGTPLWLALTTPALQGMGSKYGARRCSGLVDFGITIFECQKGTYTWHAPTAKIEEQKATAIRL